MLGEIQTKRINVLVPGGVSQDFVQLNIAINKYMSSTIHLISNYNLASKGSDTYRPTQCDFNKGHESQYTCVIIVVCQWIYSHMKIECLDEAEYIKSTGFFPNYLDSSHKNKTHICL